VATERRACSRCGQEYDAVVKTIMGVRYVTKGCPACADRYFAELEAAQQARIANEQAETRRRWYGKSGIPVRYIAKTFQTFERGAQPKAFDACLEYAGHFPQERAQGYPSLIMASPGAWGVGKTHLVCAIAHHLIANRPADEWRMCPVYFTTESDLFSRIQATFAPRNGDEAPRETESAIINTLCRVPLLILDDLGKVARKDPTFVQTTLFKLINGRYNNDLPVVVTANMTDKQMREYLGGTDNEASLDRLLEMCGGRIIGMTGKSWRRK
jgi:DNA replication protein DnaC